MWKQLVLLKKRQSIEAFQSEKIDIISASNTLHHNYDEIITVSS